LRERRGKRDIFGIRGNWELAVGNMERFGERVKEGDRFARIKEEMVGQEMPEINIYEGRKSIAELTA
jgi:hypothetical protein